MNETKRLALVAHDQKKADMVAWAKAHIDKLAKCELWGTGTTGGLVATETGLKVNLLKSGPLGGDQQLGAMIAEDKLDILIFFSDPLASMPHDVDVKALLRISTLKQTVIACNEATANFVMTSSYFDQPFDRPEVSYHITGAVHG
ncbi:methylglyoxal synthase [Rhodobacteraceae bacterium NNCM2]|nr:methylglyoxal synthase [Coraliihabitans acroporae]